MILELRRYLRYGAKWHVTQCRFFRFAQSAGIGSRQISGKAPSASNGFARAIGAAMSAILSGNMSLILAPPGFSHPDDHGWSIRVRRESVKQVFWEHQDSSTRFNGTTSDYCLRKNHSGSYRPFLAMDLSFLTRFIKITHIYRLAKIGLRFMDHASL